ncbi:MAG: FAD-dependent oxidoreductase [Azospirillaceae bacterium]
MRLSQKPPPRPHDYPDTYYRRTAYPAGPFQPLERDSHVDVAVVGGGLAGLTTALELVRRGRSVAVLEANRVAWGASGRNGGFVSPGFALSTGALVARLGRERAGALMRLSAMGARYVRETARALGIHRADIADNGQLSVIRYDDAEGLARRAELMAGFGRAVEVWPTDKVRSVLRTERYHQGLFDPAAFQCHPLNYAHGLADAVCRQGGQVHERSLVTSISREGPTLLVASGAHRLACRDVVIATGGYTGNLVPALGRAMVPVATYVMLTERIGDRLQDIIGTNAAILDVRRASDYYRVVDGDRLLWGGRITARTAEPADLAEKLHDDMEAVYPQLASVRVTAAWSGLMAYARHKMPQIGRLPDGLWYASSFGGHGLNTTAMAGLLLAQAIAEGDDRYRLFEPFGLTWTGGPAGGVAAQATYGYYRLADWWRERRAR